MKNVFFILLFLGSYMTLYGNKDYKIISNKIVETSYKMKKIAQYNGFGSLNKKLSIYINLVNRNYSQLSRSRKNCKNKSKKAFKKSDFVLNKIRYSILQIERKHQDYSSRKLIRYYSKLANLSKRMKYKANRCSFKKSIRKISREDIIII